MHVCLFIFRSDVSSHVTETLTKLHSVLKNHPELKQAFGMFLPPDINLRFQTGFYSTVDDSNENEEQPSESPTEMKPVSQIKYIHFCYF